MKATLHKIIKHIKTALPWAWRFLIRAARYPTGRRLLALAIVAAATALGLNWPFEKVQEALNMLMSGIGIDGTVSLETVIGGVFAIILGDGMFRSNDSIADAKRYVLPNRIYIADIADPAPSLCMQVIEGANQKVAYYELRDGELYAVAESGAARNRTAVMTKPEQALFEHLKARL